MLCDLLVHVDGGQAGRRRVRFAVDLALRIGARLSGIHVTPPLEVPPLFKPSLVEKVAADLSLGLINRCGLAMLHKLAGANPVQVIASHEPGIEPCRHIGNDVLDA